MQLERMPRMADFARLAVAAEPALDIPQGAFLAAYAAKRADAHELALEGSPLAEPVRALATKGGFVGSATDLLGRLADRVDDETRRRKTWPANARAISGALRRIAPNLLALGVAVDFEPAGLRRGIAIRTAADSSVPSVRSVQPDAESGSPTDPNEAHEEAGSVRGVPSHDSFDARTDATDATDATTRVPSLAALPLGEQGLVSELVETFDATVLENEG